MPEMLATARDLAIGLMSACVCGAAWASNLREPAEQPASAADEGDRDRDAG